LAAVGDFAEAMASGARAAGLKQVLVTKDPAAAASAIAQWSGAGDWILVKASRGIKLERVIEALQTLWPAAGKRTD
jgi:UDP-N-acetylmuramyl pentapeptide synthase